MTKGAKVSRAKPGEASARKRGPGSSTPGPYKTALRYNRKGVPSLPYVVSVVDIPPGEVARPVKGGGDKWVKMAGAMEAALDHLRMFWETLDRARIVSGGGQIICGQSEVQALLDEVKAAASILSHGLKAR